MRQSWSTPALVLMIAPSPIWAAALMTAPAMIAIPRPSVAEGDTTAFGLTALMSSKPISDTWARSRRRKRLSPIATKAFFTPFANTAGSTVSVPRIGMSPRTKPVSAKPVQPRILYFPSARSNSMTTFACPPDPITTTASGFMLLENGPVPGFGPDKRDVGRRQLARFLFSYVTPRTGLIIESKQRETMSEESVEPFGRADFQAL